MPRIWHGSTEVVVNDMAENYRCVADLKTDDICLNSKQKKY